MAYTSKFVKYYEKLGWNNFSLSFFDIFKKYFPKRKFYYLDVACGTGALAAKVKQLKNAKVDAFDSSLEMINVARKKSKKTHFFIADMVNFRKKDHYDIITCLYDAINCLKSIDQWKKFFENMHYSLHKRGILIFDYNNLKARENWQKKYETKIGKYKIIQKGKKIKNGVKLNFKIFYGGKNILNEYFVNYMYKDTDIKKTLRGAGFMIIKEYKNKSGNRNFIFARKQ